MANELYVYWDSCVFVDAIQRTAGKYETLEQILESASLGGVIIVSSMFTLAEVVKCNSEAADPAILTLPESRIEALISGFFENPYIQLRPVDRLVTKQSRELTRKYHLKPPDALQVATAMLHPKVKEFHTYDEALVRKVATASLGMRIGPARWEKEPVIPGINSLGEGDGEVDIK